jgi:hypothetical protein
MVGHALVVVPTAVIELVTEYELSPHVPLAHSWVSGVGFQGGRFFASVALQKVPDAPGVVNRKGIIMAQDREGTARWAVEVDRTVGISSYAVLDGPFKSPHFSTPPGWLRKAQGETGREAAWLDVECVASHLRGEV